MRVFLVVGLMLLNLTGCGNRVSDPDDNTEQLLMGMWDSVTNNPTVCHERIRLNSDKTFWWFKDNAISTGTYAREGDQPNSGRLNFMFTNKAWELVKFTVSDRDLYIERVGTTRVYAKAATSLANNVSNLCPTENNKVR
jgi:hypothetical protein